MIENLSQLLTPLIGNIISGVKKEYRFFVKNRILEYQTQEYKRNYYTKTLLFRQAPIELDKIYYPLKIKKALGDDFGQASCISTKEVGTLFDRIGNIALFGTAGSGKSTLLKYIYVEAIRTDYKTPIKIELRYLNDYDQGLSEYIFQEIFMLNELVEDEDFMKRLFDRDKYIFLFDGFDEVTPTKMARTLKEIDSFTKRYEENKYIITSRNFLPVDDLPLFTNFTICSLSQEDIYDFISKQSEFIDKEVASKILKDTDKYQSSFSSFFENPLLLTMFILTIKVSAEVPTKESTFYSNVFDALVYEHDSFNKLSFVRSKFSELSIDALDKLLQVFSFATYFSSEFNFSRPRINSLFNSIKKDYNLSFDNRKLTNDLLISYCLWTKEGNQVTYPHRSLQEYFTAKYISYAKVDSKSEFYKVLDERNFAEDFETMSKGIIVEKKTISFIDKHLLYMLSEMDFYHYCNLLLLPWLKKFNELLNNVKKLDNNRQDQLGVFYNVIPTYRMIINNIVTSSVEFNTLSKPLNIYSIVIKPRVIKKNRSLVINHDGLKTTIDGTQKVIMEVEKIITNELQREKNILRLIKR